MKTMIFDGDPLVNQSPGDGAIALPDEILPKTLHVHAKQGFSMVFLQMFLQQCVDGFRWFPLLSFSISSHSYARNDDFRLHSCFPDGLVKTCQTQTPLEKGGCLHTQMVGLYISIYKSLPLFNIRKYPRCSLCDLQPVC